MNKQIKKYLKRLKEINVDDAFLKRAKDGLSLHMRRVPAVRLNENLRLNQRSLILNFKTMVPVILILALITGGGGTAYASQGSLPGDALYPVKIATEDVRLAIASVDPETQADFRLEFAGKRVEEIKKVLDASNGKSLTGKQEEALNKALENFDSQLAKFSEKAQKLKLEEKLDRVARLNSELSAASGIYKESLETARENSKGRLKVKLKEKLDKSIDIAKKSEDDSEDEIGGLGKENKDEGLVKNAQRFIDLAVKDIADAEAAIAVNSAKLSQEAIKNFSEKLTEAKSELAKAREEFAKSNYKEAFEKARAADKEAAKIILFIKISPKGAIKKIENGAPSASSTIKAGEGARLEKKDIRKAIGSENDGELKEFEDEVKGLETEMEGIEDEIENIVVE